MTRHDPGIDDPTTTLVCCHGQLARSCDLCSLEAEIKENATLCTENDTLRAELDLMRLERDAIREQLHLTEQARDLYRATLGRLVDKRKAEPPTHTHAVVLPGCCRDLPKSWDTQETCAHPKPCYCYALLREP